MSTGRGIGLSIITTLLMAVFAVVVQAQNVDPGNPFVDLPSADDLASDSAELGTTSPDDPYFHDREDLEEIDIGQYIIRDQETGEAREVSIVVREGERIFCSVCGELLEDTVQFRTVSLSESTQYWDDGTHGDAFPNDGVPSRVDLINDQYIGPYCYENMLYLEGLRDRAQWDDYWEADYAKRKPMVRKAPTDFYVKLNVATMDADNLLPNSETEPLVNYYVVMNNLTEMIEQYEDEVLASYKLMTESLTGEMVMTDYYLHDDYVDPTYLSVPDQPVDYTTYPPNPSGGGPYGGGPPIGGSPYNPRPR